MKIGIGLPATTPGVQGNLILNWARRADAGPFSTLGLVDRLVYDNFEPLITLATVAGATERIRLTTTILLAPLHSGAILAKQSANLDALSGCKRDNSVAHGHFGYWWRSRFSCLVSNDVKLRMNDVFDFTISIKNCMNQRSVGVDIIDNVIQLRSILVYVSM